MPACEVCGGFGTYLVPSPTGVGIISAPCSACASQGKQAAVHTTHYPPEVINALRAAGQAQTEALGLNPNTPK